jgi:hypothetical protein
MKIVCHGCSFTKYYWPCWPKFVEWFTEHKVANRGSPGSGNETISRAAIDSAMELKSGISHMYIMWSGVDRYEVVNSNALGNKTYCKENQRTNLKTWYGGHPEKEKNDYYRKYFWNENQQYYRTLEQILRTQHFLNSYSIRYTMMIYKQDVLRRNFYSNSEKDLYNEIDWSKFVFYKGNQGLHEYSMDNFKNYYCKGESHPPPIAHYYWTKNIMFKSELIAPQTQLMHLENWASYVELQKLNNIFYTDKTNTGQRWTVLDGDKD